ncbi:alpha/beta fold hydrolase [Dyella sp. C9]|uniref:alpha/beta hydrolase n=1 Tax=Dyella sp. C9 TaxID=2202154 RepID=UPI0013008131|nr:alpha/beta fold hydrolase [Dyella sp. C9]
MAQASENPCVARSAEILDGLRKGEFATATRHFDTRMTAALGADKLADLWQHRLPQQFGAFDHAGDARLFEQGGTSVAETPLYFAGQALAMRVSCNEQGEVAALFFARLPGSPTAPVLGEGERRLDVSTPLGPLPAVLRLPQGAGPFPAVVLVAGSGPNDRDETVGQNKPFRDIAEGLAAAGIASLRFDKRTLVYGAKVLENDAAFGIDQEVTDDALAAVRLLAAQQGIDPHRVFVLGHSLGAYMAPRIGQRAPQLAGLILLAAPARPLLQVSAQQLGELGVSMGLSDAQVADKKKAIADEQRLLASADPARPPQGSYESLPQGYWLSMRDYDAVTVAGQLAMPMLVLQGDRDFQVFPVEDYQRWQKALGGRPQVGFHQYAGLNHLFMPAGKSGTPADYQLPGHVDGRVIEDVAQWIKAQAAAR